MMYGRERCKQRTDVVRDKPGPKQACILASVCIDRDGLWQIMTCHSRPMTDIVSGPHEPVEWPTVRQTAAAAATTKFASAVDGDWHQTRL